MDRWIRMKILIYMIRWKGGIGSIVGDWKSEMEKAGHEVTVISREDDFNGFSFNSGFFKIRKFVKENNFDVLFTQDWSCALPFLFHKNHYCFFHGKGNKFQVIPQWLVNSFMKGRIICADYENSIKFNCHWIAHGMNLGMFKPLGLRRCYLGWIEKGTETITKEEINKMGKKLGIPVLIAKGIPRKKMNEFYNKLSVFVSLPPRVAGCQFSYMEAMASGVPIILGNNNGEGFRYPVDKNINELSPKNYRQFLIDSKLTSEHQTNRLLEVFK